MLADAGRYEYGMATGGVPRLRIRRASVTTLLRALWVTAGILAATLAPFSHAMAAERNVEEHMAVHDVGDRLVIDALIAAGAVVIYAVAPAGTGVLAAGGYLATLWITYSFIFETAPRSAVHGTQAR